MAKTVSEEETQLRKRARRRLVGAIMLAIAAVVILPMLFDSEPKRVSQEIDIRIPSENSVGEFTPKIAPAVEVSATATSEKPDSGVQQTEQAESAEQTESQPPVQPAEIVGKLAEKLAENKSDSKAGARVEKPAAVTSAFVVQLGAFSDSVKAKQQQQNLASNGTNAYMETFSTNKGEMIRVRVGPFPTREEAEEVREKLKKLGLDGVVTGK